MSFDVDTDRVKELHVYGERYKPISPLAEEATAHLPATERDAILHELSKHDLPTSLDGSYEMLAAERPSGLIPPTLQS